MDSTGINMVNLLGLEVCTALLDRVVDSLRATGVRVEVPLDLRETFIVKFGVLRSHTQTQTQTQTIQVT